MAKGRTPKQRRSRSGSKHKSGPPTPKRATTGIVTTGRKRPVQHRTSLESPPPADEPVSRVSPALPVVLPAPGQGSEGASAALARLRSLETLETAYEVWLELKQEHGAA